MNCFSKIGWFTSKVCSYNINIIIIIPYSLIFSLWFLFSSFFSFFFLFADFLTSVGDGWVARQTSEGALKWKKMEIVLPNPVTYLFDHIGMMFLNRWDDCVRRDDNMALIVYLRFIYDFLSTFLQSKCIQIVGENNVFALLRTWVLSCPISTQNSKEKNVIQEEQNALAGHLLTWIAPLCPSIWNLCQIVRIIAEVKMIC